MAAPLISRNVSTSPKIGKEKIAVKTVCINKLNEATLGRICTNTLKNGLTK